MLAAPNKFSSGRNELEEFQTAVALRFAANADRFTDEQSRVRYIASLLEGEASLAVRSKINGNTGIVDIASVQDFWTFLYSNFGDPDRRGTAQRAISNLRMKNRTFSAYVAEFNRYIGYCDFNDEAKKSYLLAGISAELRNDLITLDLDGRDIQGVIALCQAIDQRRRDADIANSQTRKAFSTVIRPSRPNTNVFAPPPTTTRPSAQQAPAQAFNYDPMDLSTANVKRKGPLSEAEKTRRRNFGLCNYCGEAGHFASSCPKVPGRGLNGAAVTFTQGRRAHGLSTTEFNPPTSENA